MECINKKPHCLLIVVRNSTAVELTRSCKERGKDRSHARRPHAERGGSERADGQVNDSIKSKR